MEDYHSLQIKRADTFAKRFIGLMFRRSIHNSGLLLSPCNSVHMFFMRFPIDVVFVDQVGRIIFCIKELKPWRVSPIVKNSYYVLEMPCGSIERFNLHEGKRIVIPKDKKDFFVTLKSENNENHLQVL
ncbi:DUF192 domain-containing protein [Bacillus sp. RO1]|uniref:DUF192 domain-containing protein n=1 Tax=Bacillus sp. RO1 TaxID=2722703 RepID=UPI0014570B03|nr:DUF192 domain-containing protein [Bacillus sp. RO1]NLP50794.1 DUF192 domain-containing protein [Bacillus sp. RO1]